MMGLALLTAAHAAGIGSELPVIRTPVVGEESASRTASGPQGALIGCVFLNNGATEANPSFAGFGIYLPSGKPDKPIAPSMITDPSGILGANGFEKVESGSNWIRFEGRNSLRLGSTGGSMFTADLTTHTGWKPEEPGICQVGHSMSRQDAFDFFTKLLGELNAPGERGK